MPRLSAASGTPRPQLQKIAMEHIETQEDFVGLKVLPIFEVAEKAAEYPVITSESLLSMPSTKRAPRAGYARDDYEFELDDYDCEEHGFEEPVDEVEAKLYARFFDAEEVAMLRALGVVLRTQEKRIADMLFNIDNFTAHDATNEWDDGANATPVDDVNAGKKVIHDETGIRPNALIITYGTSLDLTTCTQIINRIKDIDITVPDGQISAKTLARIFQIDQVLIAGGRYNTAKKGQDAVKADIWNSEYAMLAVVNSGKDIRRPQIGRTFLWTTDSPVNAMVESYEEEKTRSTIIRCRHHSDEELLNIETGYLLGNITTAL